LCVDVIWQHLGVLCTVSFIVVEFHLQINERFLFPFDLFWFFACFVYF